MIITAVKLMIKTMRYHYTFGYYLYSKNPTLLFYKDRITPKIILKKSRQTINKEAMAVASLPLKTSS
ncbi:hypothetical protein QF044_000521 [Chryseobacterium sp. W4I1]|nr:hypothetical protein [Chryseobacterium sp. W4I1]